MAEARRSFDEGICILRDVNDRYELGTILCSRGESELKQSNRSAAEAALAEAESIAEDLAVAPTSEFARDVERLRRSLAGERKS